MQITIPQLENLLNEIKRFKVAHPTCDIVLESPDHIQPNYRCRISVTTQKGNPNTITLLFNSALSDWQRPGFPLHHDTLENMFIHHVREFILYHKDLLEGYQKIYGE